MSDTFKTKINNSKTLDISRDEVSDLDIVSNEANKFHILKDHKSYDAEIITKDLESKTYNVKVNNNTYTVSIEDDLDQLINKMGFELSASSHVNSIKAPMPGLILEIEVSVGQEIKENDTLLILEAMKMENVIVSPRDGVIKAISVEKGDAVEKNQLLIEFE